MGLVTLIFPCFRFGLELAHDPVEDLVAALRVGEVDGGAEDHPVAGELGDVDHVGGGDPVLDLGDAPLDVRLLLLGRVVLGVLGEVAVGPRLGDLPHDALALHALEALQLLLQGHQARRGSWACDRWASSFTFRARDIPAGSGRRSRRRARAPWRPGRRGRR